MFHFDVPPFPYVDPWKASYEERRSELTRGKQRVAYFYENPDNSTFRYRVYNMIQVLRESKQNISAAYFHYDEIDRLPEIVDLADVLVVCRSRYTGKLNYVITKARNKGKQVFFDIDDFVFDPAYVHHILYTLDQDVSHPKGWDHWFAYVGRMGATLRLCDMAITTNSYLAARIGEYSGRPVRIIPNFLNREQIEISRRIMNEKRKCGFSRNENFHLGFFSGTPTHNKDFEIVSGALARLLETDPRIVISIAGFFDLKGQLGDYSSRIVVHPFHDFINLQRLIGQVEINLVPLQDNIFTNCKSELKYFEAAIVGTVSVASPVMSYSTVITDGDNGYLARSFEWYEKLRAVIDAADCYEDMAERAFSDAEEKFAWYHQIDRLEKTLFA